MQSKRRQQTTIALFFTVLLFLLVMAIALPSRASSWLENRDLAKKPSFPTQIHDLKEYARAWDTYLADQVPFRDSWLRGYAFAQLRVLGKSQLNGVVAGRNGYLLSVLAEGDDQVPDSKIAQTASQYAGLADLVSAYGGTFLFAAVPDKGSFERQDYPSYMKYPPRRDAAERALLAALEQRGVESLNVRTVLEDLRGQQLYYKTDHHWTFRGAYAGYGAIMSRLGFTPLEFDALDYRELPNPFLGSLNRIAGLALPRDDHLTIGTVKDAVEYDLTVDGDDSPDPPRYYVLPKTASERVSYPRVYGGDGGEVVGDTHRPELPDLLLIGDSFISALEPLLYVSFNRTTHLDLRYFKGGSVLDYVEQHRPDYVVIVLNGLNYLNQPWNVLDK